MTNILEKLATICRKGFAIITHFSGISPKRERILDDAGFVMIHLEPFFVRGKNKEWPQWVHLVQIWVKRDAGLGSSIHKLSRFEYQYEQYEQQEARE
jgi:hypothetical protein